MPNELEVPKELLSLIEKREGSERRKKDRRKSPSAALPAGQERRKTKDRRKRTRRDD